MMIGAVSIRIRVRRTLVVAVTIVITYFNGIVAPEGLFWCVVFSQV